MTLFMTRSAAKVRWTDLEKARVIAAGREIRRGDPTRGDLSTLRKAMREALPPDRHRPLKTLPRFQYQWFVDGLEPESEPIPESIPDPVPEVVPAPADVTIETLVGLNRDVLGAVRTVMADLRLASEAMLVIARHSAATRQILARVVAALDPGLLPDPEPGPTPVAKTGTLVTMGSPTYVEPAVRTRLPRIAIVAPNRSQVQKIREELRDIADLRIFETAQHALRQRFGNCQHVICTKNDMKHKVTASAEDLVGKARVHFLGKSGADAIIERAKEIAQRHGQSHEED